jgi:hypothetical protein
MRAAMAKGLARWERRVLLALSHVVAPERGAGALSLEGSGALAAADAMARGQTRVVRIGLRCVLFAIEWFPLLLARVPGRFSRMSEARRARVVARLLDHRLYEVRILTRAACAYCFTIYYSRPEVARSLGYDPAARLRYARAEPNPAGMWHP